MYISELITKLNSFKQIHGDLEIEFNLEGTFNSKELKFEKLHEGFYKKEGSSVDIVVCEFRLISQ